MGGGNGSDTNAHVPWIQRELDSIRESIDEAKDSTRESIDALTAKVTQALESQSKTHGVLAAEVGGIQGRLKVHAILFAIIIAALGIKIPALASLF